MSNTDMNASTEASVTPSADVDYRALYETSEKRRKDAQSSLTPVQQENARLKAELAIQSSTPSTFDAATAERLEELKYSDPDAWRLEYNAAEQARTKAHEDAVKAKEIEIVSEMTQAEVDTRMTQFFAARPDIDSQVVLDSMPKAILDKIDEGSIGLEDALQKTLDLMNGATVASVIAPSSPNLGDKAGSREPTDNAKRAQASQGWANALV